MNDSVAKFHKAHYAMGDTLNEELFKQLETNDIRLSSVYLKSLFSDLKRKKKTPFNIVFVLAQVQQSGIQSGEN